MPPESEHAPSSPDNPFLAAALDLAARGFAVHPLRPGGKAALVPKWQERATTDPAQIRAWWEKWPSANVGVALGLSSHVVIDCDRHHEGQDGVAAFHAWAEANDVELGDVPCGITPRDGRHYYFVLPAGVDVGNGVDRIPGLPGIEIRAGRKYVVAPPSYSSEYDAPWSWSLPPADAARVELPAVIVDIAGSYIKRDVLPEPGEPAAGGDDETGDPTPAWYQMILRELARVEHPGRNEALNAKAHAIGRCFVAFDRVDRAAAERDLTNVARRMRGPEPLDDGEIARTIKSGLDAGVAAGLDARVHGSPSPADDVGPDGYKLTAVGNGKRLVARHGADILYLYGKSSRKTDGWHNWDERRWRKDAYPQVHRWGVETIDALYQAGVKLRHKKTIDWALKTEKLGNGIDAMLGYAAVEQDVTVYPEALDADPLLYNCENGVLDLRTGELLPHERFYLMTKLAPVVYDPDARSELWEDFLDAATNGNREVQAFLRRAVGYTLTGDTGAEKFFFLHGPPRTGKSTFIDAIKAMMGPYAVGADRDTFVARQFAGGIRSDVARLAGARLVTTIEFGEGKKLADEFVSQVTGGDVVTARGLWSPEIEFRPQFKLWIGANNEPVIRGGDSSIFERVIKIPFMREIPEEERDPYVKARLVSDPDVRAAVLAWAVPGCLEWQERGGGLQGLAIPDVLRSATEGYRANQDELAEFIEDCCLLGPEFHVERDAMREAYFRWADENHVKHPLSKDTLTRRLTARKDAKIELRQSGPRKTFYGIGLKADYHGGQPAPRAEQTAAGW
jgi:P4 family phage/plasmid primase-like protien